MKVFAFTACALFNFSLNSFAMDIAIKTAPRIVTRTPCPFINNVIKRMIALGSLQPNAKKVSVIELVKFSVVNFNIDKALIKTLANGRADDNGDIVISDLLDPHEFPAHRGSFARVDANTPQEFAEVDEKRLDVLVNNKKFSTALKINGETESYISYEQLKDYQTNYCWSQSDMSCKDRIPAKAEAHLLWALFGAYRVKDSDGTELIPLNLVDDFLRNSNLPEDFKPNTVDPATRCSVGWAVLTE